ncbi:MAG: hypothetical protein KGR26_10675, partial [Cyanobacteria bacterium REEB65]|nr:hypothetical protein [Cyanobacteria bacterium REEB65]
VTYQTVTEAERALGHPVALPAFVPAGFALYSIEVPIFYRTPMMLLSYTDGANWLYVQYRPKPTLWVTLLAGSFAVQLVEKFQELSFQAPYNYFGTEQGDDIVFTYGDLYPDQLQRVANSLQLASASR